VLRTDHKIPFVDTAGGRKWGVFRSGRKSPRRARGATD